MNFRTSLISVFIFSLALLALIAPHEAQPASAQSPDAMGPFSGPVIFAHSFDGDVRALPPISNVQTPIQRPLLRYDAGQRLTPPELTNPLASPEQNFSAPSSILAMPTPSVSFKGINFGANYCTGAPQCGSGYPPDTNGDIGPNHYIQAVNTAVAIYDKAGNRLAAFKFPNLFGANGGTGTPCDTVGQSDPVVLYDALADRWLLTILSWDNNNFVSGPYYECIAVSKTNDPVSGGWWLYGFQADSKFLPDYPKWGMWNDAYYMSANMFDILNNGGGRYQGARAWAFDRVSMLSGGAINNQFFNTSTSYFGLLPGNLRGALPPANTPNFFTSIDPASGTLNTLHLWKFHVDWITPTNTTFTGPTNLAVSNFVEPPQTTVPELNGNSLDTLGDRLMMQLQYRNLGGVESFWATHSINRGSVIGVRWYEVRSPSGTPTLNQQGTFTNNSDGLYRWMPSLAIDHNGDMAVGYSVSSSRMHPAIRYAGRLVTDTLGALAQGEASLIKGTGAQNNICGTSTCTRWGDYSALTIDPVDDCTF